MIDLHMHTKYSDGTDSVQELLEKAEHKKIDCISITDHNTCKAYEELKNMNIKQYYSGSIITGVELNTKVLSIPIEILGYGINAQIMQNLINEIYITNQQRCILEVERLYKKCNEEGIEIPKDFIQKYDATIYPSKYLHQIIVNNEKNKDKIDWDAWENSNIFYRKYMSNPDSIFFINMDDVLPNFNKASDIIRDAGGKVFIPHIYEYRKNSEKILNYILQNYKIDGIECYYTTFTKEQNHELLSLCKQKKLLVSGGSDYHGKNKVNVEIGVGSGNLKIPNNIINEWKIDKIY